jgi:glutamine amidotransferase
VRKIPPVLRRFILGTTDSEVLFYLLLGKMAQRCDLERRGFPLEDLADAAREAVDDIVALVGPPSSVDDGPPDATYLTFVVTNGRTMLAHQGGKALHVSTHKTRCPDRDSCPHFAPECEQAVERGFVSHLIFSSEPLQGQNVWNPMRLGDVIGVDWRMQMQQFVA